MSSVGDHLHSPFAQSSTTQNDETNSRENQEENITSNIKYGAQEKYSDSSCAEENLKCKCGCKSGNLKVKSDSNLTAIQWEKNALEKSLVKCTCLLTGALRKLEQIDEIVSTVNEKSEDARNEEIQEAFYKSRLNCTCPRKQNSSARSSSYNFSEILEFSKANLKMQKAKRTELLRKISDLRKKLKKICMQEIILQIRFPQQKSEKLSSNFQMAELGNCPEEAQVLALQINKEKLKAEKDRLVSQICRAFTALNAAKKCSNSYLESSRRNSIPKGNYYDFRKKELQEFENCNCGCKGSDKFSDSENREGFESFSTESDVNKKFDELRLSDKNFCSGYETSSTDFPFRSSLDFRDLDLGKHSEVNLNSSACIGTLGKDSKFLKPKATLVYSNHYQHLASLPQKKSEKLKEKGEALNTVKKSKIKFACEESPCRKNIYADDLSAFKNSPSQEMIILKAVKNIQTLRPSTVPVTKREKLDSQNFTEERNFKLFGKVPERRVKSEATMKEIEKTLRNYEQRLCDIESLEYRVEQLKEKSSEACQLRKKLKKAKADAKKQRAVDRENSNRERTRLCLENWELKKKIQRLKKRSDAQSNNIQNLNCILMKFESETEELKKELAEYQIGFEHQQKYICKCKCTLAKWKAEIENLKSHIRRLTAMKESSCNPCQDNRCIQRSRSYSPEKIKERVATDRPKTQTRGYRTPSEEEVSCYCRECEHLKGSRNFRQRLLLPIRQKM